MKIWCIIKYRCECTYTFLFRREKAVANQHFSLLGLIEKVGFEKISEEINLQLLEPETGLILRFSLSEKYTFITLYCL